LQVVVFSDSHGSFDDLCRVIEAQPNAEIFLHLGDGEYEVNDLRTLYPQKRILFVRGNCDFSSIAKDENMINVAGKRIFFTHGHMYEVKRGLAKLIIRANDLGADIVCFGHTHSALYEQADKLYLLNPGSVAESRTNGAPSYATIDIEPEYLAVSIVNL